METHPTQLGEFQQNLTRMVPWLLLQNSLYEFDPSKTLSSWTWGTLIAKGGTLKKSSPLYLLTRV